MTRRFERLRVMHRDRVAAAASAAACAAALGVLTVVCGQPRAWLLTIAVAVMIVCAAAVRPLGVLCGLATGLGCWVVSGVPATTWWSLPAGAVLFGYFCCAQLACSGSDSAPIPGPIRRLWWLRYAAVTATSSVLAAFGLLLRAAQVHGSLLLASIVLLGLAAGLLITQRVLN